MILIGAARFASALAFVAAPDERSAASLALTRRAMKRGTARLDKARDGSATARSRARLALTPIDAEGVLKIPQRPIRMHVIAQGGSARGQRLAQDRADFASQPIDLAGYERTGSPHRRDAGPMERLADIDVAEPGDPALIEKGGFDRGASVCERRGEGWRVKSVAERFEAEFLQVRMARERPGLAKIHEAEPANVVVDQRDWRPFGGGQLKPHVVVCHMARLFEMEGARGLAGFAVFNNESAAHAKMHDERFAPINFGEEELGAPGQAREARTRQPGTEAGRKGKPQILAGEQDSRDARPHEHGFKPPANGFDLGQFRHGWDARRRDACAEIARRLAFRYGSCA